jgi:hypothetical protein
METNQRFGGKYRLHIQGRKTSQARRPRRWSRQYSSETSVRQLTFKGLHDVSQKTSSFTVVYQVQKSFNDDWHMKLMMYVEI